MKSHLKNAESAVEIFRSQALFMLLDVGCKIFFVPLSFSTEAFNFLVNGFSLSIIAIMRKTTVGMLCK